MIESKPKQVVLRVKEKLPTGSGGAIPYNDFKVIHTWKEVFNRHTGKWEYEQGDTTLEEDSKLRLALNVEWVKERPEKEKIPKQPDFKFDYWGHLIHNSIRKFNERNKDSDRCRKLVYDLRHGEADHNALKKRMRAAAKAAGKPEDEWDDEWCKNPEYKRQPGFNYPGKNGRRYNIVDPPLTGNGERQAREAGIGLRKLKEHMFPIPNKVYVSPLYRAMQTYECAFANVGLGTDHAIILHDLREQKTGNCADVLSGEYDPTTNSPTKKPPQAGTKGKNDSTGKDCIENDNEVMERAKKVHDDIFAMDDSDCVARVTHSLLIRYNLMNLEANNGKVMQKFMLDEGGLIAYVIEGQKATPKGSEQRKKSLKDEKKLEAFTEREKKEISRRYKTAFPLVTPKLVTSKHGPSKHVPSKSVIGKQNGGASIGKRLERQTMDQRNTQKISMGSRCRSTGIGRGGRTS